ncbi:ATP-binding cassette domain-containing protein [Acidovorax sp. LjRoot117]|uniref:ATP-binding cassette domain-containing protein n=1 Tax=Acidovorax sp. LjRoot117 TaxID=3342255 RepID=UPI003ECF1001
MNNNKTQDSLAWALERLAQLQGVSINVMRLRSAVERPARLGSAPDVAAVCASLDLSAPVAMDHPDRVMLPLLCQTRSDGWGVVVDRDPQQRWVVEFAHGTRPVDEAALSQTAMVAMRQRGAAAQSDTFEAVLQHALRQYRGVLVEAALASVFMGLLALAISLFSMQVYDRVIPTRSEYTLIILGLGVLLAILLETAMKFARSRVMDSLTAGLDSRLSRDIFQRLLSIRVDQLPGSVGSLAGQIRGYEQVRGFYTGSTLFALVDFPMALLFLAVLMVIGHPLVALVPLVCGLLALLVGVSRHRRVNALAQQGLSAASRKTGLLVEVVEGAETIKAGVGGWKFLSRWIGVNSDTIRQDLDMRHVSEGAGYLAAMLQQFSYVGIVMLGSWVIINGGMTMGALIACSIIGGRIMAPLVALPGLIVQHAHAQAATRSLEKLYALQADNHGVPRPLLPHKLHGHYVLQEVAFAYGQNAGPAVSIQSLTIQPGEKVAVIGPIGSGKSSLLKLLAGLYRPTAGRVLIDSLDMAQVSQQVISQHIGYLQQEHRLFQGTLRENLLIGMPDPGDDAMQAALQRSGLIQLVAGHPRGLDLPIHEGGKGLSGGQRQLVAFTRLLLTRPAVLLLDEPTANMDSAQEKRCLSVLAEEVGPDKTLVVVTHKPSVLPLVDRIVVVSGHKVVMDGPRDAVLMRLKKASEPVPVQRHDAVAPGVETVTA